MDDESVEISAKREIEAIREKLEELKKIMLENEDHRET